MDEKKDQEISNSIIGDKYNLERFLTAQEDIFSTALSELKAGRKRSHWMWYIFPQIDGLGHSSTAKYFSIKSHGEAAEYLNHPVLGQRLIQCAETLLKLEGRSVSEIFGYPDDLKLRSSMTLFEQVANESNVFSKVLEKYFDGKKDMQTVELLNKFSKL
jgi:uncharacterized protein (DUF1810 family)